MAIVVGLLGKYVRSGAHDVCRWYQDYRNAKTDHSISKQLLVSDVVAHAAWASGVLIDLSREKSQRSIRAVLLLYYSVSSQNIS